MNIEDLEKLPQAELAKLFAAWHALAEVKDGMKIGIGTGSTASWFVKLLAGKQSKGLTFRACATSSQTTKLAESLGIKIESLDDLAPLDLVIDGADEFSFKHNLIKGGGGALLQEKITARSAKRFIVITDSSKEVENLGKFPLPVEIVQFAWQTTRAQIGLVLQDGVSAGTLGGVNVAPRTAGDAPFITDEGHYILDLELGRIANPRLLDNALRAIAGVVETGLFLEMADSIIMADGDGLVESKETSDSKWKETRYELADLADMLLQYQDGQTPLHDATWNQDLKVIMALLDAGADVHAQNKIGRTPLHHATRNKNIEVIMALLDAGADVHVGATDGETPLHHAASYNENLKMILALLDAGADINAQTENGSSPLKLAAAHNKNPEVILALLDAGADVHARDCYGNSPLHWAAMWNTNPEVIMILLKAGADGKVKDKYGETAFDLAEANTHIKNSKAYQALNDARYKQ